MESKIEKAVITGNMTLGFLSIEDFFRLLNEWRSTEPVSTPQPTDYTKGYVYGLKGISQLFNVSHVTAQRYKDTFLKPAVKQNGRKIVVDVAKAMELFDEYNRGGIK